MEQCAAMSQRPQAQPRASYPVFRAITTRWMDNDVYGHVNNVVYYSWFDTAVNAYLIEQGALDIHAGATIGLVVETQCNYFDSLAFPQTIEAGIRVAHLGKSSVRYEVGLFAPGEPLAGGPQMVEVSRDGRRVYFSNSLYAAWDEQFYPAGVKGWATKLDADPNGGMKVVVTWPSMKSFALVVK